MKISYFPLFVKENFRKSTSPKVKMKRYRRNIYFENKTVFFERLYHAFRNNENVRQD